MDRQSNMVGCMYPRPPVAAGYHGPALELASGLEAEEHLAHRLDQYLGKEGDDCDGVGLQSKPVDAAASCGHEVVDKEHGVNKGLFVDGP